MRDLIEESAGDVTFVRAPAGPGAACSKTYEVGRPVASMDYGRNGLCGGPREFLRRAAPDPWTAPPAAR